MGKNRLNINKSVVLREKEESNIIRDHRILSRMAEILVSLVKACIHVFVSCKKKKKETMDYYRNITILNLRGEYARN
jgi:predicted glycosyltransferase